MKPKGHQFIRFLRLIPVMFNNRRGGFDALLQRKQPSSFSKFCSDPTYFLAQSIYKLPRRLPSTHSCPVTVVCISDTHNYQPDLPDGDILVHAGDLTQSGSLAELQRALNWLNSQPHQHKFVVAGNHDLILDASFPSAHFRDRQDIDWGSIVYLQNNTATVQCARDRTIKIYGSPFSARHGNWAFQYPPTIDIWEGTIPENTDILITHGPPKGHLDLNKLGCGFLLKELWRLSTKPKLHVFGHIHEGYGIEKVSYDRVQKAYDDFILSGGGVLFLIYLWYVYILSALGIEKQLPSGWLVNASVVGGLRDEKRRGAVTINI
ncbi:hypothetical protein LOZ55_002320 [Ophidiomyces ophidiicola]|nr:hypothetical protein LOZ55_002320 [Ophidiomyces ophidiicola]